MSETKDAGRIPETLENGLWYGKGDLTAEDRERFATEIEDVIARIRSGEVTDFIVCARTETKYFEASCCRNGFRKSVINKLFNDMMKQSTRHKENN